MRTIRYGISGLAFIVTLALSTSAVWAQQPQPQAPPGPRHDHIGGSIASVSDGTIVLTGRDGRSVTVHTTASTRIVGTQQATLADVHAGDMIRVVATKAADGTLSARAVQVAPAGLLQAAGRERGGVWQGRSDAVMVAGTVAAIPAAGTLTVASPTGQRTSVTVPSTARVSRLAAVPIGTLTAGTRVMVMVQGQPNTDGSVMAAIVFVAGKRAQ